jgi:hypothetical protein
VAPQSVARQAGNAIHSTQNLDWAMLQAGGAQRTVPLQTDQAAVAGGVDQLELTTALSSGSGYVAPLVGSGAQRTAAHANGGLSGGASVLITGGADIDFDSIFAEVSAGLGANSSA